MASAPKEPERRPGGAASSSESQRDHYALGAPARRSGVQRFLIVLGSLGTVMLLLAATAVGYGNWRFGQIERLDLDLQSAAGGPQNYLIVGSDTRAGIRASDPDSGAFLNDKQYANNAEGAGQRSDSIMILRVDPKEESARLLSLPRDLYVPIAGTTRSDRINAAFADGPKVLIQTIQDNFEIVINHYVEVDFVGFQKLINSIGGITLYFDQPVWDGNTGLNVDRRGCVTLDGSQALAFARSRHLWYHTGDAETVDTSSLKYLTESQMRANGWTYDGTSDMGRISRQQMLIRTAIPVAKSKAFRNPATLNAVVESLVQNVSFDRNLGASDLIGLSRRFESFDANELKTYTVPSDRKFVGGADVQIPDMAEAESILALFRDGAAIPEAQVVLEVLNASGIDAQAANAAGALQRVGFTIKSTANAQTIGIDHLDATQVRYAPGSEDQAKLVAAHLTGDVEFVPTAELSAGHIVLVTGANFAKVTTQVRKIDGPKKPAKKGSGSSSATTSTSTTVVGHVPESDRSC